MQNTQLQPLSLSCSEFCSLRQMGMIYVDKTEQIFNLCKVAGAQLFLARPRRFGKSLLVSTFESLFKYGLRDFQGLAIEKLWQDAGTYKVVRLDLSDAKNFSDLEKFANFFERALIRSFGEVGFVYERDSLDDVVDQIGSWLRHQPSNSVVLLIDEYDAPLTACLHRPELFGEVQLMLSRFFQKIKTRGGCLRFFFMTGITKFSNTGIFSGFNNLDDISLYSDCGTLLGYTEGELRCYFAPYLEKAADTLGLTVESLIEQIRTNYDGFCFDTRAQTHVYCPWSVLKFLAWPQEGFNNYWYLSAGQPSVLMNYLKNHSLSDPKEFDKPLDLLIDSLTASQQYQDVSLPALLTQAGYLTIKEALLGKYVTLGYPNREVRRSMAALYAERLFGSADSQTPNARNLVKAMASGQLDACIAVFNAVFNSIDYHRYPVTDEAACRAYLHVFLMGSAMCADVEKHTAHGRSDLEVNAGDCRWVFEIKYAREALETPKLLEEGLAQIRKNYYGETTHGKKLIRAVLVFDEKQRRFTAFADADSTKL